jgi:hypothetical protein
MVNPTVRKNEMFYLDIVFDDVAYYEACEEWCSRHTKIFRDLKEKAQQARQAGHQPVSNTCPVRELLPMATSCESFYLSLLYHCARFITSIESFNALMNDILHYNRHTYLGWMRKQMNLMMMDETQGGLVRNY